MKHCSQYVDYLVVLNDVEPDRVLFLAVPDFAWNSFFQERAIQKSLNFINANVIVYSAEQKIIVKWIKR